MDTKGSGKRYYPSRSARRTNGGRHASKGVFSFAALARAASKWLVPRAAGLAAKARRYSSQFAAVAGVLIVLMSVYLVRQGFMAPSSLPFGSPVAPGAETSTETQSAPGAETPDPLDYGGGAIVTPDGGAGALFADLTDAAAEVSTDTAPDASADTAPASTPPADVPASGPKSLGECLAALAAPASGKTVRGYGYYWSVTFQDWRYHPGVDIALTAGDPVKAASGGLVVTVEGTPSRGWRVVVSHGFGVTTVYGHLGTAIVSVGQQVTGGQTVGRAGQPGSIEADLGVHLHYEIRVSDEASDPTPYLGP